MALRLIEIFAPQHYEDDIKSFLKEIPRVDMWVDTLAQDLCMLRVLMDARDTEKAIDVLEQRFSSVEGFRLVLLPVEATIPRQVDPPPPTERDAEKNQGSPSRRFLRISREELFEDVCEGADLSWIFLAMVVLSSVVAAIGLARDNPAVIIGAMVIAPFLGPNMALALATTLGDMTLAKRAIRTTLVGAGLAFAFSVIVGLVAGIDLDQPEIVSRTDVGISDVALALASGTAGALAFTTGVSTTLVGVMVAVALLPPLVTTGVLVGAGRFDGALAAFSLFLINLTCVNLAGVASFAFQGIRPKRWYEAQKARRAMRNAVILWVALLVMLVVALLLKQA